MDVYFAYGIGCSHPQGTKTNDEHANVWEYCRCTWWVQGDPTLSHTHCTQQNWLKKLMQFFHLNA